MSLWKELIELHVVKKLAEIINRRWRLNLQFVDHKGALFDVSDSAEIQSLYCNSNSRCGIADERCGKEMMALLAKFLSAPTQGTTQSAFLVSCPLGGKQVVVPIVYNNQFYGCARVAGFFTFAGFEEERKSALETASACGWDGNDVEKYVENAARLDDHDVSYLTELVELVVNEIVLFQTEMAKKERRLDLIQKELISRYTYESIIGKSRQIQELFRILDKVIESDSTVLIQGENGTGKELIARAIHFNSPRKGKPFIVQNCSAFNDNLLDSELFGHKKGSFTGAIADKQGLFEIADGGTFFLDEIGDMSPALQVKLLRVLQEGTFIPVGDVVTKRVNVRIIAATNKDLKRMVESGEFREDLYYRINVINLTVPPLRDRKEDIPVLAENFLEKHSKNRKGPKKKLSKQAMGKLLDYNWPGNIRELENEIERLIVLSAEEKVIGEEILSQRIRIDDVHNKLLIARDDITLPQVIEEIEKSMIYEKLKKTRWNKSKAAVELGISRRNLIRKVKQYQLDQRQSAR